VIRLLVGAIVASGLASCVWASPAGAADCNAIQTAYAAARAQAQVCDLSAPDSCSATRPFSLQDVCQCKVAVNPAHTADLDRLLGQFKSQGCTRAQRVCTRLCRAPARKCAAGLGPSPTCSGP
jgi:hypothetical protein